MSQNRSDLLVSTVPLVVDVLVNKHGICKKKGTFLSSAISSPTGTCNNRQFGLLMTLFQFVD